MAILISLRQLTQESILHKLEMIIESFNKSTKRAIKKKPLKNKFISFKMFVRIIISIPKRGKFNSLIWLYNRI